MTIKFRHLLAGALALAPVMSYADDADDSTIVSVDDEIECCANDRVCPPSPNDVVGYRECPRYGKWGRNLLDPYMFVDLGVTARYFAVPTRPIALARTTSPTPGKGSLAAHQTRALTFDERVGYGFTRGLYMAVDFELGNLADFDAPQTNEISPVLGALASIGARGSLGFISLSAEISGGGMEYSTPTQDDAHGQWLLEARGRVDLWMTPWFTLGGMLGASLIDRGDWLAGAFIGVHTWSFAGDR